MNARLDDPKLERVADGTTATWLDAFLKAIDSGDVGMIGALAHDEVRVRLDGTVHTIDQRHLADTLAGFGSGTIDEWLDIVDVHESGDDVYALFRATVPTNPDVPDVRARMLGYSILHLRDGRLDEVHCYLDRPTGTDVVIDLRDRVPEGRDSEPRDSEPRDSEPRIDVPVPAVAVTAADGDAVGDAVPARASRRGRRLALPLAAIGSWLVQDLVLAIPVVAFAARFGSPVAFATLAPVYAAVSLVLSLLTVRMLSANRAFEPGRLARYSASADRHPRTLRLLRAGGVLGFLLSAYLLSGPPTTWALHRLGVRRGLRRLAAVASVVWGIGFVGFYVLAAEVVL